MHVTLLLVFIIAFIVSLVAIPSIIKVANEKSLFDKPSEDRKIHTRSTPNLGGVSIFLGFYFSVLTFRVLCESIELSALCAASVLLFFVALKDDLISTGPKVRLFYQFIIALIIILIGQIFFTNIPFFEAENTISRIINMAITLIFIVAMINAVNFIDGIDGLAGSICLFSLMAFAFIFYQYGETSYAFIAIALAGSTLGFLLFNFHPAKIFMGDIGSMLLGVFLAVFVIKLSNLDELRLGLLPIKSPTTVAFSLVIVPLMDMITVIIIRMHLKLSPFMADTRHTHHRLLGLGMGHTGTTLILLAFNIFVVAVALLTASLNHILGMLIIFSLAAIFEIFVICLFLKKEKTKING
jgi:UDP-GlcNAc:undecaprenyl-phosphate/decaprenyl-phosphate GlcNAc-1-phosphate transferase